MQTRDENENQATEIITFETDSNQSQIEEDEEEEELERIIFDSDSNHTRTHDNEVDIEGGQIIGAPSATDVSVADANTATITTNNVGEDPSTDQSFRIPYHPEFILQAIGAFIGIGFTVPALINLDDINRIIWSSYASPALEEQLPRGLIYVEGVLITVGTFASYYSALGLAMHIIYNAFRTFPYRGQWSDVGDFFKQIGIRNSFHVLGAFLGTGIASTLLYYNIKNPEATFQLPFSSHLGIPTVLVQIVCFLYIIGGSANLFAYGSSGSSSIVREFRDIISEIFINIEELFSTCGLRLKIIKTPRSPENPNDPSSGEIIWRRRVNIDWSAHHLLLTTGAIVGLCYGLPLFKNLEPDYIALNGASHELCMYISIHFWRFLAPIVVVASFANYYAGLGATIDFLIHSYKNFPQEKTWHNFKKYLRHFNAGNVCHVLGALYGIVITGFYLYENKQDPDAEFALPFGAQLGVPLVLLQMGAPFYVMGSRANLASYVGSGNEYIARYIYQTTEACFKIGKSFYNESVAPLITRSSNYVTQTATQYYEKGKNLLNHFSFFKSKSTPAIPDITPSPRQTHG